MGAATGNKILPLAIPGGRGNSLQKRSKRLLVRVSESYPQTLLGFHPWPHKIGSSDWVPATNKNAKLGSDREFAWDSMCERINSWVSGPYLCKNGSWKRIWRTALCQWKRHAPGNKLHSGHTSRPPRAALPVITHLRVDSQHPSCNAHRETGH